MVKRSAAWCLAGLLVLFTGAAWAQDRHQGRVADEKLVAQIDFSSWLPETFRVSPDNKRIAYITQMNGKQLVVVDGIEGRLYESIAKGSLMFSPDSKRFAYVAQEGKRQIVVVDGVEGKPYDGLKTNPIFNANSKRVVYVVQVDDKVCVVVDGNEGKLYDDILTTDWGKIIFDSPDRFHYFARKGNSVVLVEERVE